MQTIAFQLELGSTEYVFIELPPGKAYADIQPEMVIGAIGQQLGLDVLEGRKLKLVGAGAVDPTPLAGFPIYRPFADRLTMAQRCDQIGVSENTLFRWRREGVDIWCDDAVRARIGSSRRFIPGLSDSFKVRLSDQSA